MDGQTEQLAHSSSPQGLCSLAQCRTGHRVVCHLLPSFGCVWPCMLLKRRKCIAQRYCWFYYSSKEPFSKEHRGRIERRITLRMLFAKLYDWLNHRCFFKAGHHWDLMQVFSAVGCIYSAYCFLFINFCLFFFSCEHLTECSWYCSISSTHAHLLQSFCCLQNNLYQERSCSWEGFEAKRPLSPLLTYNEPYGLALKWNHLEKNLPVKHSS